MTESEYHTAQKVSDDLFEQLKTKNLTSHMLIVVLVRAACMAICTQKLPSVTWASLRKGAITTISLELACVIDHVKKNPRI